MKNSNKNLSQLTPVKSYTPPTLPSLESSNPELLKKLPSRWQKKAAILAGLGVFGLLAFSGCDKYHDRARSRYEQLAMQQLEAAQTALAAAHAQLETTTLDVRSHFGGGGSGPFYVVYFTEQEALAFIQAKLEAAGLNLSANAPGYEVNQGGWFDLGLSLWDEQRRVGISHITWENNNQQFFSHGGDDLARRASQEFAQQHEDISVGVFFNPDEMLFGSWDDMLEFGLYHPWDENFDREEYETQRDKIIAERKEGGRQALIDNLTNQVQEFINSLQREGIL